MSIENHNEALLQVADLHLDRKRRLLWRGDQAIQLPKLTYDLFLCLVRHAPAVVSTDQLLEEVWGAVVVNDETVKQRVSLLRQALDDSGEKSSYVESVRSIGYRLIPPVTVVASAKANDRRKRWIWRSAALLAALAAVVVLISGDRIFDGEAGTNGRRSLAVLPFDDLSPNGDRAYFSDGMQEEIIMRLSAIPMLAVTSRTSVLPYRSADKNVAEIADELGVELVIEGSVRHADDRIRITIQLIDAASDDHLWAQSYDRPLSVGDIFDIQSDVAEQVSTALQIELRQDRAASLQQMQTGNLDAYNNYLLGRFHIYQGNPQALQKSIEHFEAAIEADPGFAAARVGLGQALTFAGTNYGWLSPREAFTRAEEQAELALQLAPDLVEGHSLRGDILAWYRWQWEDAELAYQRAIELGGNYDLGYTLLLSVLGRHGEAIGMIEDAISAFPRDPWVRSNAAWRFLSAGRYTQATEQADFALQIDARFGDAFSARGWAHFSTGEFDLAISEFRRLIEINGPTVSSKAALAVAEAGAGNTVGARQLLDELLSTETVTYIPAEEVARVYVALGEFDAAFEWLERAFRERSRGLIFLNDQVSLAPIRTDPRFIALQERMNL